MRLRFEEDRRTLLWAFVLFPAAPSLALIAPRAAFWCVPLVLYVSYLAGVIAHNHNHCPTFRGNKSNLAFGAWISVFYGLPIFAWVPTHNRNHHRYVNGELDATSTSRHSSRNTLWAALSYPLSSSRHQLPALRRYVAEAYRESPRRFRRVLLEVGFLVLAHAGYFGAAVALHGREIAALSYFLSLGAPALLGPYWMMLTNYLQHVDCDPASPDNHSRNFTSPFFNWFVFDGGYHTVHHEYPGVHWSRYRALHAARAARIDPRLEAGTPLGYMLDAYLFRPLRKRADTR